MKTQDVVLRPVVTEKSTVSRELANVVTLAVRPDANKQQIKEAVESIWSVDVERALELGDRVETGTLFINRCDYLDPALAWTGVKNSGRGCTLSKLGFEVLTRPKSFHARL